MICGLRNVGADFVSTPGCIRTLEDVSKGSCENCRRSQRVDCHHCYKAIAQADAGVGADPASSRIRALEDSMIRASINCGWMPGINDQRSHSGDVTDGPPVCRPVRAFEEASAGTQ